MLKYFVFIVSISNAFLLLYITTLKCTLFSFLTFTLHTPMLETPMNMQNAKSNGHKLMISTYVHKSKHLESYLESIQLLLEILIPNMSATIRVLSMITSWNHKFCFRRCKEFSRSCFLCSAWCMHWWWALNSWGCGSCKRHPCTKCNPLL